MSDSHDPEGRINPRWTEAVRRDNESWARSSDNAYIRSLEQNMSELKRQRDMLLEALNPRLWTKEMSDAWHKNIPDTVSAFDALRAIAAMKGEK